MLCIHDTTKTNNNQQFVAFSWRFFSTFSGNFCVITNRALYIRTVVLKKQRLRKTRWKIGARCAMMKANVKKEQQTMFENGTFAVLGPDGKQVQCDVLFTYDCEDNGRSYVVFTTGEGAQQRLFANRYDTRDDGQLALLALENEQEYAIIKHCFEELKAKLAEQAAAQEGEAKA